LHIKPTTGDDSVFTNGLRVERNDTSGQYGLFNYAGGAASITAVETTASNPVVRFLRSTNGSTTTETARFDASGRLLVGTSTSLHHNAQIQTAGTGYYGYNHFQFSNDAFAPTISVKKSRSASVGGNTIVQDGDRLGTFSFFGADGSTFLQGADITAFVDGTPGVNDLPTRLVFSVTSDGASSPSEALRISNDRSIAVTQAPGKYTISTSENSTSVANSGTIDFSNFTGMIMISDHFSGQTQVWITGGGNVASLGTAGGTVGSLAYNGGVNGYRWTNNTGATRTFGFFCVRTRQNG
jgi:hypothetical protein